MEQRLQSDIKLLEEKGILIDPDNINEIFGYLQKIGYHRLSIYTQNTQDFAIIKSRYIFDKRLRILITDMLEVIENSIKSVIFYHLGNKFDSNLRYINETVYKPNYSIGRLEEMTQITENLRKRDQLVKNYFIKNPTEQYLPDYIFFDKITFGELYHIFGDFDTEHKKTISKYYGMNYQLFENRVFALKYLRNLCSHFEHIYHRTMVYAVKGYGIMDQLGSNNTFIAYFMVISIFQKILIPNYTRSDKVIDLINKFNIPTSDIGIKNKNFPSKLESEAWEVLLQTVYTNNIKNASLF